MAQKTEQLPKETLDKLVSYQTQANELILNLGQIHLRIRELQLEIKRLESVKEGVETESDKIGLEFKEGDSAIVPVMLYDAKLAQVFADKLLLEGIYVIGFFFPVVAKGQARIRVQLSAAHTKAHLDKALAAFEKVGKELGVIK